MTARETRRLGSGLLAALLLASPLFHPRSAAAAGPDRSQPPVPGPARPLRLPPVQRLALSNGLPVLLAEAHEVPLVNVLLLVSAGAAADPAGQAGLSILTADLLDEGAGGKDALALADALDFLGADLETHSGWDASTVRLNVPSARLAEALPLMADVALRPDFPAAQLERLRNEALTTILQARDDAGDVASWALSQAVFGKHRYARPESGDAASLASLRLEDVRAFHARHFRPGRALLVVVGDVTPAVLRQLEGAFGAWPAGAGAASEPPLPAPAQLRGRSLWLVDKPGAPQSAIRIGRVGPPRLTPDFHAIEVMNTLLGGFFSSRLNDNLREQHGYSYGAFSDFDYRRVAGVFAVGTDVQTDATGPAVGELLKELARISTPATPAEVERARNYLALGYPWQFETSQQLAGRLAGQWLYGLPADVFTSFVPRALAVGAEELRRAGRDWVDAGTLAIVVVGDRARVEKPLRALDIAPLRVLSVDDVMGAPPRVE